MMAVLKVAAVQTRSRDVVYDESDDGDGDDGNRQSSFEHIKLNHSMCYYPQ